MFEENRTHTDLEDISNNLERISDQIAEAHETLKEIKLSLYIIVGLIFVAVTYAYKVGLFS